MKKIWSVILIFLTVFIAIFFVINQTKRKLNEIKIGAVLPLTGRGATYGEWAKNGLELAFKEINSEKQMENKKIEIIYEDSQSSGAGAVAAMKKLIDVNKIPIVLGFVLSDEALSSAPTANSTKTVLLSVAAGNDKIKDAGDYVFRNRESGSLQGIAMAEFCFDVLKEKEASVLYSISAAGINYKDSFEERFKELGGQIVLSEGYDENKTDYRTEIEKLKNINSKVVFLTGLDTEIGLILRQSRELGFKPQFLGTVGTESPKLIEIAQEAAEGIIYASSAFNPASENEVVRNFIQKYNDAYGHEPEFIAANSYDALKMVVMAVNKYGYNSEGIKRGLYEIKDFNGAGGITSFDAQGEVSKSLILKTIKNGTFLPYINNSIKPHLAP